MGTEPTDKTELVLRAFLALHQQLTEDPTISGLVQSLPRKAARSAEDQHAVVTLLRKVCPPDFQVLLAPADGAEILRVERIKRLPE